MPIHAVYVVRGLQTPLLRRPAIPGLRILGQVNHISERCIDIKNAQTSFPSLISGRGKFKDLHHNISLREDEIPYSLLSPRRIPLPLMPCGEASLQRMESDGIIKRIDESTDWCSGMVVVPKPDGEIFICTDFTRLNENVRRERHILPFTEHLLATIQGTTIFFKLNPKSGFYQILLAEAL